MTLCIIKVLIAFQTKILEELQTVFVYCVPVNPESLVILIVATFTSNKAIYRRIQ